MDEYRLVIYVLAGVITVLGSLLLKLYLRNEKRNKENQDTLIELMKKDIESRRDLQDAIASTRTAVENNNQLIRTLPDSIYLAFKKHG